MKKQILSLILATVMLFGITGVSAQDWSEPIPLNIYDNELFEIMGEIKDIDVNDGTHGDIVEQYLNETTDLESPLNENGVNSLKNVVKTTTYADGSRYSETVTKIGATEYIQSIENAFNNFFEGDLTDKYLVYNSNIINNSYFQDYYVLEKAGEEFERAPFLSIERIDDIENYISTYNMYTFEDTDGEIKRTLINEKPLTVEEFDKIKYGSSYNDGLKFKSGIGFTDINDELIFSDLMVSYYFCDYNLGYIYESSNNGDTLDWSVENPERLRRYTSGYTNILTNESYYFENAYMEKFNDKGYSVLFTKDAEGNVTGYTVKLKKPAIVTVFLNDRKIKFDQIPVIDNGRTLVPLRAIFEKLGAEIEWNGETKTVTAVKGETKIELTVDSTNATKNGEAVNLDVPAKIVNGRTMIPVRFVADCFGVEVGWNEEMKQVQLTEK